MGQLSESYYTESLGYWIKRYTLLANQMMDVTLKPYGIGRTQWYILFHVNSAGTLPQRKLQELLEVESATLTTLVSALVRKGLLQQQSHPSDGRGKVLYLSVAGETLWQQLPNPITTVRTKALRNISAADIATARTVLETAVHNLEGVNI